MDGWWGVERSERWGFGDFGDTWKDTMQERRGALREKES